MLSAYTEEGAITTFDCLSYGAIDFIAKPSKEGGSLGEREKEIIHKVTRACQIEVQGLRKARIGKRDSKLDIKNKKNANKVILMGGGEGGYSGFLKILPYIHEQISCAVLAVQYMDDRYFESFCHYLNQYSRLAIKRAEDQEVLKEGVCYFANQKTYLKIQTSSDGNQCQVAKKPDFLSQQNVFNHLLFSAAETYGANAVGILLGGQGVDGIEGLKELKRMRGVTLSQNPKNCICSQILDIALQNNCIDHVVNDSDFPGVLWHLIKT
jgi:two-component system chemotaxis response regulator CheB